MGNIELHLGGTPPYQETVTVSGVNISNPVPGTANVVASASPPAVIRGVDTDYKTPYMQHWSLDIQQQLTKNTIVTVGYYGSKGTNLIGVVDLNNLPAGYAATQQCAVGGINDSVSSVSCTRRLRQPDTVHHGGPVAYPVHSPYRRWRGIFMVSPRFNSDYHSLQVFGQHRFTGASQINVAYTWSKNLTDNQTIVQRPR